MPMILLHILNSVPMQIPTIPNFRLTHGSVRGFFDSQKADVVCFQARLEFLNLFYTVVSRCHVSILAIKGLTFRCHVGDQTAERGEIDR